MQSFWLKFERAFICALEKEISERLKFEQEEADTLCHELLNVASNSQQAHYHLAVRRLIGHLSRPRYDTMRRLLLEAIARQIISNLYAERGLEAIELWNSEREKGRTEKAASEMAIRYFDRKPIGVIGGGRKQ